MTVFVCFSFCVSVFLCLSVCLSTYLCLCPCHAAVTRSSPSLSVCLSLCVCFSLFICLFICTPVSVPLTHSGYSVIITVTTPTFTTSKSDPSHTTTKYRRDLHHDQTQLNTTEQSYSFLTSPSLHRRFPNTRNSECYKYML